MGGIKTSTLHAICAQHGCKDFTQGQECCRGIHSLVMGVFLGSIPSNHKTNKRIPIKTLESQASCSIKCKDELYAIKWEQDQNFFKRKPKECLCTEGPNHNLGRGGEMQMFCCLHTENSIETNPIVQFSERFTSLPRHELEIVKSQEKGVLE